MKETCVVALAAFAPWAWLVAARAGYRRGISLGPFPALWICSIISAALIANALGHADGGSAVALEAIAVAAIVDVRSGYIFDPLIAAGLTVTLGFALLAGRGFDATIGALVGSAVLLVLWLSSRGRGLGLGDVKLGAVLGAGLGPAQGVAALGLAFIIGGAVAGLLLATGKVGPGTPLRFGPYLLAGILSVLSYHQFNTGVIP